MDEEVKKISFGFSKFTKKTQIVSSTLNQIKPEKNNVELIDCFEGKAIKLKNVIKPVDQVLVIPLKRHQEAMLDVKKGDDTKDLTPTASTVAMEISDKTESELLVDKNNDIVANVNTTTKILSLDEIAAKEILEDLNNKKIEGESRIFTVPLTNNPPAGEKESSLEDYENIPVGDFGVAMLRGMGWAPGKGIGKSEKLVTPSLPTLRPKGMGLGADTVLKSSLVSKTSSEDLKMVKNSFIRVIAGQHKDSYGQIEGFDDESGRLIVKLSLKNMSISLNEFMVQLVDKAEFSKNSKVINVSKYEQYKDDENRKKPYNSDTKSKLKSLGLQNPVHEQLDNKSKGVLHKPSFNTSESTKLRKRDSISPERGPKMRETDRRECRPTGNIKQSHKHSNKRRSRSSSNSSTNSKSTLKMSKGSFSKRARSSGSSVSSADSYRRNRKLSKRKHKHKDNVKKSSHRAKSKRKKKYRSSSSSSSSSNVSTDSDKRSLYRTEKKTSHSKSYQSTRRSQSPARDSSSKKHKNKHR